MYVITPSNCRTGRPPGIFKQTRLTRIGGMLLNVNPIQIVAIMTSSIIGQLGPYWPRVTCAWTSLSNFGISDTKWPLKFSCISSWLKGQIHVDHTLRYIFWKISP